MANQNPNHVVTGKARLSYCNLVSPKPSQFGGDPKYSVTILIPKSDVATKQRIDAAIEAATVEGVSKKWQNQRPPKVKNPVHDGDGARPSDGAAFGEECKGCWVVTASNTVKPRVVDIGLNDILDATEIYSGMYGRVGVDFFPYANGGNKGIGCSLINVQKLEDGEPLAARSASAEDDFGQGAPTPYQPQAPAYGAPQPPYAPPAAYPTAPAAAPRYNPLTGRYE